MSQTTQNRTGQNPQLIAWHVPDRKNAPWNRIGAAWAHKDGNGFTLRLDLMGIGSGRIVLRDNTPKTIKADA